MQLQDEIRIRAPRTRVFAALQDPEVLRQAIPGCETVTASGPNAFAATVSAKVGPLKASFSGQVALSDIVVPESYTLTGEGKAGPAGHAKVISHVRLADNGAETLLSYDVQADIGGKLAQLGGALVEKTSRRLAGEFFARFEQLLTTDPSHEDTQDMSTHQPDSHHTPDDGGHAHHAPRPDDYPWFWFLLALGAVLWAFGLML